MDILNPLAPRGAITQEVLDKMVWPPAPMRDMFAWWTANSDRVLADNPFWYQIICGYSPFVYAPFYIAAVYAFVTEKNWIRVPTLVFVGMMFGALPPVFLQELVGYPSDDPHPSQTLSGKLTFLGGYGSFLVVPAMLLWRMARGDPFPKRD
jgi:hypothetical protein